MKILMLYPKDQPFDAQTVRIRPMGGTEKTFIFLGEAFAQRGHDVHWITDWSTWKAQSESITVDIVITPLAELLASFPKAYGIWWCHLLSEQPSMQKQAPFAKAYARQVVTLSKVHQQDFQKAFGLDSVVIGHGVWPHELHPVTEKDPYRLIYTSIPYRGLDLLPALYEQLKEREPRANLTICSSMQVYNLPEKDAEFQEVFDQLAAMEGVRITGALNQPQLYAELAQAQFFIYPCLVAESYCLAMDEAVAHGCWPLVTEINCKGALGERAGLCWWEDMADIYQGSLAAGQHVLPYDAPISWLDVAQAWEEKIFQQLAATAG